MAQYQFNVGRLFGVDTNGNPMEFGLLQDVTLDISRELKELTGANAFAEVIALGKGKITGKASSAEFSSANLNMMMGGLGDISAGQILMASEAVQLSNTLKTLTVANAANFNKNLGVTDITNPLSTVPLIMSSNAKLATPVAPTVSAGTTGGTIPAGTYSIKVAALNTLGYNTVYGKGLIDQQLNNLVIPTSGVTAGGAAGASGALTGSTNQILATVTPVDGAIAYAWFVGLVGNETLQVVTSSPSLTLLSLSTGGSAATVLTDTTGIFGAGNYVMDPTVKGKYDFNQTDANVNKSMIVNYLWKDNSAGQTINLNNKQMGIAQYFSLFLSSPLVNKQGITKQCNVWLNAVVSSKLGLGWKLGDFQKPQFDFQASSDAVGGLGWMSLGN